MKRPIERLRNGGYPLATTTKTYSTSLSFGPNQIKS